PRPGLARANSNLVASGREHQPWVDPKTGGFYALIRVWPQGEIQLRPCAALRLALFVHAEERQLDAVRKNGVIVLRRELQSSAIDFNGQRHRCVLAGAPERGRLDRKGEAALLHRAVE